MDATPSLGLPLLAAAQAQKHVTHNEAVAELDALVQCALKGFHIDAPPASPAPGDRYVIGPAPTGAWAGRAGLLAVAVEGGWDYLVPAPGWRAYGLADDTLRVLDTTGTWIRVAGLPDSGAVLQNVALLGLGTTADATNPLAAKINKALFTAKPLAEGGDGSLLYTMNKEAAARDVGLLFQTNYVLHAMLGLFGGDDVALKVSPDGAAFFDALTVARASGIVRQPRLPRFAASVNYDAYLPAATWTTVPLNAASANDQGAFVASGSKFVAPVDGTYVVGASLAWHPNGTSAPTDLRARLVKGAPPTVIHGPALTKALVDGVVTLTLSTLLPLAAADEVRLQAYLAGADGYVAANVTGLWGHLVG